MPNRCRSSIWRRAPRMSASGTSTTVAPASTHHAIRLARAVHRIRSPTFTANHSTSAPTAYPPTALTPEITAW